MQYSVPQFIDKEATLIGPLTVRQSVILGITALIIGAAYLLFNFFIFSLVAVLVGSLGVVLAFIRINDRPFHEVILSFFNYFVQPRTYLWKKQEPKPISKKEALQQQQEQQVYTSYKEPTPSPESTQPTPGATAPTAGQVPQQTKQPTEEDIKNLAEFLNK